jgi:hypothetical protein
MTNEEITLKFNDENEYDSAIAEIFFLITKTEIDDSVVMVEEIKEMLSMFREEI